MTFSASIRAAAVTLLTDYATSAGVKLQVYRARPASLYPPSAFIDGISERVDYVGVSLHQRKPSVDIIVVHGLFDSGEAADQRDAFCDGFLAYSATRFHQAGANTLVAVTAMDDIPAFTPDWMPPEKQRTYYATRITLEGLAEN